MADAVHARRTAQRFVRALASNGTTTALVFGAHFPAAQNILFEEAEKGGLRISSGLVVSDRNLREDLEVTPDVAYETSRRLRERWHGKGRLRYAVTPRFSVSCTEAMLDACKTLLDEAPTALFTSHVNESLGEIDFVHRLFPGARDYLDTYERAGLLRECSVLAHNVHVTDSELKRLAASRTAVAHCPSSNAFLASGIFPMARHLAHAVRFGMGTDVGAGTGLSMLKEALVAYHVQMVRDQGQMLGPAQLLYLATAAGAEALGLEDVCGDLAAGKQADLVLLKPPKDSTLEAVLEEAPDWDAALGAVFTLAREESVVEVRVGGDVVFSR
jgi:guanine deaminase